MLLCIHVCAAGGWVGSKGNFVSVILLQWKHAHIHVNVHIPYARL